MLSPMRCPVCGPYVWLADSLGAELATADASVIAGIGRLAAGEIHARGRSFHRNGHAVGIVPDGAGQAFFLRQPVDKGAKTHPCTTPRTSSTARRADFAWTGSVNRSPQTTQYSIAHPRCFHRVCGFRGLRQSLMGQPKAFEVYSNPQRSNDGRTATWRSETRLGARKNSVHRQRTRATPSAEERRSKIWIKQ